MGLLRLRSFNENEFRESMYVISLHEIIFKTNEHLNEDDLPITSVAILHDKSMQYKRAVPEVCGQNYHFTERYKISNIIFYFYKIFHRITNWWCSFIKLEVCVGVEHYYSKQICLAHPLTF